MNSDDDAMDLETAPVIDSAILQLSERDLLYELNLPEVLRHLCVHPRHRRFLAANTPTHLKTFSYCDTF